MRRFAQLTVCTLLVLIVTDATNLVYLFVSAGGIGGVLAFGLCLSAFAVAFLFLDPQGDANAKRTALIELIIVFAILDLPVFAGDFWIQYAPDDFTALGVVHFLVFLSAPAVFLTTFYLDEDQVRSVMRYALFLYIASIFYAYFTQGLIVAVKGDRPGGFLSNANDGAYLTAMLLLLALPWTKKSASGYLLLLVGFVGVGITLSRSGLALWGVIAVAYAWSRIRNGNRFARTATIAMMLVGAIGVTAFIYDPLGTADEIGVGAGNYERIQSIAEVLQGQLNSLDDSGRGTVLLNWLGEGEKSPVFGRGTGFAVSDYGPMWGDKHLGPHNSYVARYVDGGVIGLLSLLFFILILGTSFVIRGYPLGLFYTFLYSAICLFSHDVAGDSRPLMALFAVLSANAVRERSGNNVWRWYSARISAGRS